MRRDRGNEKGRAVARPYEMVRQEGFEPPTYRFVACCSIQLGYWRASQENGLYPQTYPASRCFTRFFPDGLANLLLYLACPDFYTIIYGPALESRKTVWVFGSVAVIYAAST